MSEWFFESISKVSAVIGGGTPKRSRAEYWNGQIPWVSIADIRDDQKKISITEESITQEGLDKSSARVLPQGGIVISARGTVGKLGVVDRPMAFNQSCYGLIGEEIDQDFLYYSLLSVVRELTQYSHGGVFDTITKSTFDEIEIAIPPNWEQKAIAEVLSSLDDKIDLLKRQNKTLEGMAEALFRQWFIEEAQDDWEELPITHLIQLVGGGTPKTSVHEFWGGNIPWLAGGDITEHDMGIILKTEKWITKEGLEGSSAKLLPKWSTVISARGTVGKITMLGRSSAFSQSNYGIIPSDGQSFCFTFLLVANETKRLLNAAYGAVFDTITKRTFEGLAIPCPPSDVIHSFEEKVQPLFKRQQLNQEQISGLVSQRDTLLPKIMSGEVRVQMD